MDETRAMIPLERAWALLDEALSGRTPASEIIPVRSARGRLLASDQHTRLDLPPFDKSAMDGYAVRADDERDTYRLLATVRAGQVPSVALVPGTAVKVMTGAPVPEGTGKVIMREFTEEDAETVRVLRHDDVGNLCLRGEDMKVGDRVLPAGCRLDALDLANLVSCGLTRVPVTLPIELAVLSTGDEIVDDPACLAPGKIMNANGPMLAHLAAKHGFDVVGERRIADDLDETVSALGEALEAAEMVVVSGGVSVGDFDHVLEAFERLGLAVAFSRVAVKPGKPTVFATRGEKVVFGLPGNPVSVCLMFHLFVLRAARRLRGVPAVLRLGRRVLASNFARRKAERRGFAPVRLTDEGDVEPLPYHGSAHLMSLSRADGFLSVPIGVREVPAGETVDFLDLREPYQ